MVFWQLIQTSPIDANLTLATLYMTFLTSLTSQFTNLLLLAQEAVVDAPNGGDVEAVADPKGNPFMEVAPMLVGFVVLFYFIILRPQQREQKQRVEKLNSLKKNDKVVTAGGIVGSITAFSEDGTTVTLKVDDNTKIKFTRDSIRGPQGEPEPDAKK